MHKNHKRIAAGLGAGAIALGVALTGGTSAYFYDDETQQGAFQAGTVDLVTTGAVVPGTLNPRADVNYDAASKTLTVKNLQPGDRFNYNVVFTNAGTLDAFPYMSWKVSGDSENGVNEAESNEPGGAGELDDVMLVDYNIDAFGEPANGDPVPVRSLETNPVIGLNYAMAPGLSRNAKFEFIVPNGAQGAENKVMTDSFDLTIKFALTQVGAPVPNLS